MINNALKFICEELNKYLVTKNLEDPTFTDFVKLDNVTKAQDGTPGNTALQKNAIISLVNIEEDRVSKSQRNYEKINDRIHYANPKIHLNLYCLISVNHTTYETSLKWLSYIIQFFQHKNVFDYQNSPKLYTYDLEKLVFDMHPLNFEQVNHLWGTLGGKYLPSVMYKIRVVVISEDHVDMEALPVTKISLES